MTDILQPVSAVILVLSLLGTALYLLRRRGVVSFTGGGLPLGKPGASPRQLRVVERIPLGAQHALHLVQVGNKLVLVATSPGSCQILDSASSEGAGL